MPKYEIEGHGGEDDDDDNDEVEEEVIDFRRKKFGEIVCTYLTP